MTLSTVTNCHNQEIVMETPDVILGYTQHQTSLVTTQVLSIILEERGFTVERKEVDTSLAMVSSNKINAFTGLWTKELKEDEMLNVPIDVSTLGPCSDDYYSGLLVPHYTTIGDIGELSEFTEETHGIIYCLEGLKHLYHLTKSMLREYGLDYSIETITELQLENILSTAYEDEQWIVIAGYSPHSMLDQYSMRFLGDYKQVYGGPHDIYTVANTEFIRTDIEAVSIIDNFYLYSWELNGLLAEVHDPINGSIKKTIEEWLVKNPHIINRCCKQ